MINASEARTKATCLNNRRIQADLGRIETCVLQACDEGKTSCFYHLPIDSIVKTALEKLGYKVKHESDIREQKSWYVISW